MVSGSKSTHESMGRRARTTEVVVGSKATGKSGLGCSAGEPTSDPADPRHLEDMTEKYPDICQLVLTLLTRPLLPSVPFPASVSEPSPTALDLLQAEKIDSFIMDAEVVAVDKDTGAYRTFQDLSNRAKKDVQVEDIKVIVGVYAFDLMLLNDKVCNVVTALTTALTRLSVFSPTPSHADTLPTVCRYVKSSARPFLPHRIHRLGRLPRRTCRDAGVLRNGRGAKMRRIDGETARVRRRDHR